MWCGRRSCSWTQMTVPTELWTPCCPHNPPGAGVAGHLRFLYVYGCRFANLGLVVVCHPV